MTTALGSTDATRTTATRAGEPAADPTASGLILGRYRLYRRLGAGAFGTVWMGHDERLDRAVAVKAVPRERVSQARLEREARAAARLSHPAIVTLYEATVDDHCAYLVSELVQGHTLHELLAAGRLSDRDVVTIAIALCDALEHAHARGVIHRDIKPSNILIPERPDSPSHPVKLTDFGVARVIGGDSLTRTGDIVGTADYMAPEQAEGLEAGPAADLYALALVTYEALTGVNPLRGSAGAPRARRLGTYLPPLRRLRRDLPRALGCAIDLALRPRVRERGTVAELRAGLAASLPVLDDTPGILPGLEPAPPSPVEPPPPPLGLAAGLPAPAAAPTPPPPHAPAPARALPRRAALPARAAPALLAAGAAGWFLAHALAVSAPPLVAAGAALTGVAVLALPRVGWLLVAFALAFCSVVLGRPGMALLAGIAFVAPALRLPGPRTVRRAWTAGCGWLWVVLAAPIAGHALLVSRPPGTAAPHAFAGSLSLTVHGVLVPILRSGALAGAAICAAAALIAPWLTRPSSLAVRVVLLTGWAAASVSALHTAIAASANRGMAATLHHAVPVAVLAAVAVLAPSLYADRRRTAGASKAPGAAAELP